MAGVDNNTLFLLQMDGDVSSRKHIIETKGGVILDTSNKKLGYASLKLEGVNEYARIPSTDTNFSDFNFGNDDFTIECFAYIDSSDIDENVYLLAPYLTPSQRSWMMTYLGNTDELRFSYALESSPTTGRTIILSATVSSDTWHHFAIVRHGSNLHMFIDGNELVNSPETIGTESLNAPTSDLYFGCFNNSNFRNMNMDEIRISNIARWTSNFNIPTSEYKSDDNTLFLWHCEGDISNSNHSPKLGDGPKINSITSKWHGAYYFDGNNDYISSSDNSDWDFGIDDFTIDFWIYPNSMASNDGIFSTSGSNDPGVLLQFETSEGVLRFRGPNQVVLVETTSTVPLNQWSHIAVVRYNNVTTIYLNGTDMGDAHTGSYNADSNNEGFVIGRLYTLTDNFYFNGYIDEFRVSDIARWTSNFQVPTAPYSRFNYRISGNINMDSEIIVVDENDRSNLLHNELFETGDFVIDIIDSTSVIVFAIPDDENYNGEIYTKVSPIIL